MTLRVRSRALPRVALATCRQLPVGDEDGPALLAACAAAGLDVDWRVWDDPAVDWSSYDLVVIRSTWDYPLRRDEFLAWAGSVPRLANPAEVVRWNTDKRYLTDMARAGVPVVATRWLEPGDEVRLPENGDYVVKPAVSAGGHDTARYAPEHAQAAREHAARLLAAGQRVMVQPYLTAVDDAGETALLYCGGDYSHAVRKGPLLTGPDAVVEGLYRPETIEPREPTPAERAIADAALAAVPVRAGPDRAGPDRASPLLYARVDLLPGPDGAPLLLELELTEPSFFLGAAPGAADRFARAVAAHVAASPTGPSGR
jgi:glutathione synthase/RimK-type ligase-like ATP-grasp enzyme